MTFTTTKTSTNLSKENPNKAQQTTSASARRLCLALGMKIRTEQLKRLFNVLFVPGYIILSVYAFESIQKLFHDLIIEPIEQRHEPSKVQISDFWSEYEDKNKESKPQKEPLETSELSTEKTMEYYWRLHHPEDTWRFDYEFDHSQYEVLSRRIAYRQFLETYHPQYLKKINSHDELISCGILLLISPLVYYLALLVIYSTWTITKQVYLYIIGK